MQDSVETNQMCLLLIKECLASQIVCEINGEGWRVAVSQTEKRIGTKRLFNCYLPFMVT